MSGTIVLGADRDWSVSSGLFNWVVPVLVTRVADPITRVQLALIDEQNFKWLDLRELTDVGRQQVLGVLATDLVTYAREHLPDGPHRSELIGQLRELAAIAADVSGADQG